MSCKFIYEMLRRKPSKWAVEFEGRTGTVEKMDKLPRGKRWRLVTGDERNVLKYFRSRREAFHYFKTGERFTTNPVYQRTGRNKGARIR